MKNLRISHILSFCLLLIFLIIPFLASADVVNLAWDPSTEEDLAGYKIYYGYDTQDYNTSKDFSDQSDIYTRFYFKIPSDFHLEGNWVKIPVFQLMDEGTSLVIFYLTEANPGKYGWRAELGNPYALIASEWRSLSANTWYMVEIRWKQDPLEGGAEIWIDGVPMGSVYTEDTSMQNANSIQVGRGYMGYGDPGVLVTSGAIYFDDVKVDTSYIGKY